MTDDYEREATDGPCCPLPIPTTLNVTVGDCTFAVPNGCTVDGDTIRFNLPPGVMEKAAEAFEAMRGVFATAAEAFGRLGAALTDAMETDPELRAYLEALADEPEADEPITAEPPR